MKEPKVLVFTINYNNIEDTVGFIKSASKLNYKNFKVFVGDNSRDRAGYEQIKKKYPNVIQAFNNGNLGCTGANNVGIRYAIKNNFKYIWIMNNDVEIDRNCLKEMVKVAENDEKAGAVGSKYYDFENRKLLMSIGRRMKWKTGSLICEYGEKEDKGEYEDVLQTQYVWGGSVLYRTDLLKRIRGYNDEFFVYYEPLDVQLNLAKLGYKVLIAPGAKLWHKGGRSKSGGKVFDYYTTRNRILIMKKHANFSDRFAFYLYLFFIATPSNVIKRILRGNFMGAKWFLIGLFDGLAGNYGKKVL